MKTNWELGNTPEFWTEENVPTGMFWFYTFDAAIPPWSKEIYSVINLLSLLSVIEYGTIYEQIDCIRIKVK